ncbi:MAG: hypothetical protein ACP5OF_09195 [bacterium]
MSKSTLKLIGVSLVGLVIALTSISCGKSSSNPPGTAALIKQASDALTNSNPLDAKSACTTVLKTDPNNCSCQWVYALADLQDLAQTQLQGVVDNLFSGLLADDIGSLFTGVSMDLSDIPTRTAIIESNACEFTLSSLPVNVKLDFTTLKGLASSYVSFLSSIPDNLNAQLLLGSQWGPAEAKVLGSTANTLLAVLNLLSAHALDTNDLISAFSGGIPNLTLDDPVGLLRNLYPILFAKAPTLLAFNKQGTGPQDITNAGEELNAAIKEIQGLNASLQLDQGNSNKVIAYKDVNGDGYVDAGDTFTIGASYFTNGTWVNIVTDLTGAETITVPAMVSKDVLPDLDTLLAEFSNNLTNGSPSIVPKDFNNLLAALGLTGYTFTTNVISLNPHAFFANPQPLRYFLPTTAHNQFQIEAEVAMGSTMPTIGWYYTNTDSKHFTDGTNPIVADGISVPATAAPLFNGNLLGTTFTIPAMIPYISFSDSTMDGVLSIDLSQMLEFCEPAGTCPAATPSGFSPATNYSLNKVIAGGLFGLFTDTTGKHFTTENPIW